MWAHSRIPIEAMGSGKAMSFNQASHAASMMASLGFEDAAGEPVRAEILPDVLDGLGFGAREGSKEEPWRALRNLGQLPPPRLSSVVLDPNSGVRLAFKSVGPDPLYFTNGLRY